MRPGASGEGDGASSARSSTTRRCVEEPELVRTVAAPPALALENERLEAELRARVEELQRSRGAAPATSRPPSAAASSATCTTAPSSGSSRCRSSSPGRAQAREPTPTPPSALLDRRARASCATALEELRELARGIHPAILTDRGLAAALAGARRPRAAVRSTSPPMPPERLPAAGRGRRLLRRRRVADERRQVRPRAARRRVASRRTTATPSSRSATTASAAPTPGRAPGCAASPTGSRRSTGASRSTQPARRGAPSSGRRSHARRRSPTTPSCCARASRGCSRTRASRSSPRPATPRTCCARSRAHKPDVAIVDVRMPPTHTDEGLRAAADDPRALPADRRARALAVRRGGATRSSCSPTTPRASATCSRTASPTSTASSTPCAGSATAARRSTPRSSRACSAAAAARTRSTTLTPREREVLALMAEGRSNHAIADAARRHRARGREARHAHLREARTCRRPPDDHRRVLAVLDLPAA